MTNGLVSQPGVEWLDPKDDLEWDAFVEGHAHGQIYHLSGWKQVLEETFDHISGQMLVLRDPHGGAVIGGLPIYIVRSPFLGNRLVSAPFASFCDPLISCPSEMDRLLPVIMERYKTCSCRSIELRCRQASFDAGAEFARLDGFKHHFLPIDRDLHEITSGFSKTAVTQMVAKADRNGVSIRPGTDLEDLRVFAELLTRSRRRLALPALPLRFFESLWRTFHPDRLSILFSVRGGVPVAGLLALKFNRTYCIEYSCDDGDHRAMGVNQKLYSHAIGEALKEGDSVVSFGRTSNSNVGLLNYKRRWGTKEEDLTKLVFPKPADTGGGLLDQGRGRRLAESVIRHCPGPVYRGVSRFFYRHWG